MRIWRWYSTVGTAHRALLIGGDPTILPWTRHHAQDNLSQTQQPNAKTTTDATTTDNKNNNNNNNTHNTGIEFSLHRRLVAFLRSSAVAMKQRPRLPHPHLPTGPELAEHVTRSLGVWCPLSWQNWLRDSGCLRSCIDNLLLYGSAPAMAVACPEAYQEFQRLTAVCQPVRYGDHPSQIVDLFLPANQSATRGLVFFVVSKNLTCSPRRAVRMEVSLVRSVYI